MAGQYEEAISVNQQLLERGQKEKLTKWVVAAHAFLAVGYSMSGREEEARYHVAEPLKIRPDLVFGRGANKFIPIEIQPTWIVISTHCARRVYPNILRKRHQIRFLGCLFLNDNL